MKIEKREIVVTKEVFVAFDGMEFDNQDDCMDHEYRITEAKLSFYDYKFKKSILDECAYARLDTEEDVKLMISLCDYQGIVSKGIVNPGVYIYSNDRSGDCWVNMTETVNRIMEVPKNAEN